MIDVRAARVEDGPVYLGLVQALADFEDLEGPDEAAAERLLEHAFGEHPRYELFVAELDGEVVAYAACFNSYSTFRAKPSLFLEDVFVHPSARRKGVATAVLAHLKQLAIERDCGRFEWMVLDWNEDAQQLYAKVGAQQLKQWLLCRVDL